MVVQGESILSAGLAFWPQIAGVMISVFAFELIFRTHYIVLVPFVGILILISAGALMLTWGLTTSHGTVLLVNGLLGLGVGSTVAPGLFITGLASPSKALGRIFALVELVRSEADFIMAPVFLELALFFSIGGNLTLHGFRMATWAAEGLAIASFVLALGIYLAGGVAPSEAGPG